jgi:hypothetical protein
VGLSFLLRRARSSWLLLACVALTVVLVTGLAAVLWGFAAGAVPSGAQSALADPQSRSVALNSPDNASQATSDSQLINTTLHKAWPGVGFQVETAVWAQPVQLPAAAPTASQQPVNMNTITQTRDIQLASLDGISGQATLTAGTWPGPPVHGEPLPVALPAAVASQLRVTTGSVLQGAFADAGSPISLRVTGLFQPRETTSAYWALDLLPVSGSSTVSYTITYGPAVVNPAAFGGTLTVTKASWLVMPDASEMARLNLDTLSANTSAAFTQLGTTLPFGLTVTSSLTQILAGVTSTAVLTRSLFAVTALLLLLVAGAGLALTARLLASLREEESALLRARGATRWQLTRPVLAEAVILATVAGLVGVLVGGRLTGVLAGVGGLHLSGYSGGNVTPLAWLSGLVTVVVCVAVMVWPALRSLTPDAARQRRGRQARLAMIAWAGGDLVLVALAIVSISELRGYSVVAHPASGSLGIDPVVAIAPALAVAGLALIPVRGLPLLARLADKSTDHVRRLTSAMVSWQISRRPIRQTGPALLVVLATATTTLAVAGYASWQQSAADQAAFAVGSDVQVDSGGGLIPSAVSAAAFAAQITGARGVTAATPAAIGDGGQLIALDASTAAKTILLRSDLSALSPSVLWKSITPSKLPGLALPGKPTQLDVLASGVGGLRPATFTADVQDASGVIYQIFAGPLPFDGRTHSLVFTLPGGSRLRLLGLSLTYLLPWYYPNSTVTASLTVESLAVDGKTFSPGTALSGWAAYAGSGDVPTGPPGPYNQIPPSDGVPPTVGKWKSVTGGGQRITFAAGNQPSLQIMDEELISPWSDTGTVTLGALAPATVIPAIATAGYLKANQLSIGSLTRVDGINVQIVASVSRFPTVFGQNEALIVDLGEINDALVSIGSGTPLQVTLWWLRTVNGEVPRLPAGLTVTSRADEQTALLDDTLLTAPRQAMLAVGVAAVLLGVLGFSVGIAASLRSRRTQSAVFAAMGVGRVAQAVQLCLEQCVLSIPAATAGLLAGIGLAELMVPAITLTAGATAPVPSVLVVVPLGPVIGLALVTAAVPALAAALTVSRRPDPAARLRTEAI